jgi:hypothetical protein
MSYTTNYRLVNLYIGDLVYSYGLVTESPVTESLSIFLAQFSMDSKGFGSNYEREYTPHTFCIEQQDMTGD